MQIQAKTFLIVVFSLIGVLPVIYIGSIWCIMILQQNIGTSRIAFKQFLLEKTTHLGKRIIIDSGSNSNYSIDSLAIEKAFGKTTINIAENAFIPFDLKLHRLRPHLKRGDIVLLPLEYTHYDYFPITEGFYNAVYTETGFGYFSSMPPLRAIQIILQTPAKGLPFIRKVFSLTIRGKQTKTNDFINQFNHGLRGDYIVREAHLSYLDKTCLSHIFGNSNTISVSSSFMKNIELLKGLERESGAKFFFTFPFVAGEECYAGDLYPLISRLENQIRKTLDANHIPLIGTKETSLLPSEYLYDTYYHATLEGRAIRTQKLIEAIRTSPYHDYFQNQNPQKNFKFDLNDFLDPLQPNKLYLLSKSNNIALGKGWRHRETHGVWSNQEKESQVSFKINRDRLGKEFIIELDSHILNNSTDLTKISINGNYLGEFHMNGKTALRLKNNPIEDDLIELAFQNTNIQSPKELGIGKDNKKKKLYLKSIMIKDGGASFKKYR